MFGLTKQTKVLCCLYKYVYIKSLLTLYFQTSSVFRYAISEFRGLCRHGCTLYTFKLKHMHMGETSISAGGCTSLYEMSFYVGHFFQLKHILCLVGETYIALAVSSWWRIFAHACVRRNTFNHYDLLLGTLQVHVGTSNHVGKWWPLCDVFNSCLYPFQNSWF